MKESHIKGLVHAAMSALAIVEAAESKHAARRALNGLSAVYHALCVVYHLKYEIDENQDLTSRVPRARIQAYEIAHKIRVGRAARGNART